MSANDLIDSIRDRLDGPARHLPMASWRDDVAEFFADVRDNPAFCALIFALGLGTGAMATAGLAYVVSWFL
jgi:hypothetical protein